MLLAAMPLFVAAEDLKLTVPELRPELVEVERFTPTDFRMPLAVQGEAQKVDFDFFKSKTAPGVRPYKVMDDLTFVGVPLFVAGIAIKGDKANFRQDYKNTHSNTRLITNFKTGIDDYTQFFGPVATVGLKLAGVEGRSDWPRLMASALMSYGIMAGFVNGIKYTASEMRPDGSTANSWPSGHTATSFVGATVLHKEYGLTRSPWYSVAGYGVATATGVMRILNNRHWISDVLSGAGIGIMSTELGYALGDILFKGKGLLRNDLDAIGENPSFFAISMGVGYGLKDIGFNYSDLVHVEDYFDDVEDDEAVSIDFHTATAVDAEGAYFFNKYIGIGGRLRVRAMTAKSWSDFVQDAYDDTKANIDILEAWRQMELSTPELELPQLPASEKAVLDNLISSQAVTVESDHLTEFSANVGRYFNLPLGERFSLGSKLLIGRSMTQELDINSKVTGKQADIKYTLLIENGRVDEDHSRITSIQQGPDYEAEWDYLTLGGNNSTTCGTGLSLTYRYKSNFSWRLFVDYDYSQKKYTLTYDPQRFMKLAAPSCIKFFEAYGAQLDPYVFQKKINTHYYTIGGSFAINF